MVKESVFTDKRRELLAKTIMDIIKVAIAAFFASEFFAKFNIWIRVIIAIGIITLLITGLLICPKRGE